MRAPFMVVWVLALLLVGGATALASPEPRTRVRRGEPPKKPPAVLAVAELDLLTASTPDRPALRRTVRVAYPRAWTLEPESDGRSIRLFGPEGEGTILIAAALHPSGLDEYLADLKRAHPSVKPTPPLAMSVPGIRSELGERATRFAIQGPEVGEMVMIERNDAIVLFATLVEPSAWPALSRILARSYAAVEVLEVEAPSR